MTSLQRAAAYLKKLGPKAALAIVPLAAAAVPAQAGLIFDVTAGGYATDAPEGSSTTWNTSPLTGSLIQGVHNNGTFVQTFTSGSYITSTASASGGGTGVFPGNSLAVNWDFTLRDANEGIFLSSWSVTYNINGAPTLVASGSQWITGTPVNIANSAAIAVPSGQPLTSWSASISLGYGNDDFGDLHFDVAHLDITGQDTPVPEPATFLLIGPVGAFVIFRARRRRR